MALLSVQRFEENMDLKLPKLGEGADSGVVVSILVKPGDDVKAGQTVIELENEKAVAPIPATASGKVASIRVKEGDKISVGAVILTLEGGGGGTVSEKPDVAEAKKPKATARAPVENEEEDEHETPADLPMTGEVAAAPSIRKLARDIGLDLRKVRGSANGGRIVLEDIRAHIQRLEKLASQPKSKAAAPGETPKPVAESIDFSQWGPVTKKPLSQLRKVIARRMSESWHAVPRVTQFDEADVTALMELRKKHAAAFEAKGARLTMTPLILKSVVAALKQHPVFNSSLDETAGELVLKEYFNLGIAVDTEAGLMVPVIRDVDKKTVLDLAKELDDLAKRTRERKITADEMKGGTFTISNQGAVGGAHFTPIINLPEVAILGLGRGVQKPVVRDGQIVVRTLLPLTVAYDHRVIDGGSAARFVVDLVKAIESFDEAQTTI
jgi:pyruvate dehydrogenase E2 component (dihydrolipoamide acetyltransferase)